MEIKRIDKDWITLTVEEDGHVVDFDIQVSLGGLVIRASCRSCDSHAFYVGRKWVRGRGHVAQAFHLPNLEEVTKEE